MSETEAPMTVVLRTQDGRAVPCELVRDPGLDRPEGHPNGALQYWRAVPAEPVEMSTCDAEVTCPDGTRGLPPHVGFWVDVPLAGPGLSRIVE